MPADLHIHSNLSDGTDSPGKIVEMAKEAGLTIISISDHDNVFGAKEAIDKGLEIGIDVVSGIEFTTEMPNTEVHILGYFFDPANPILLETLEKLQKSRKERIFKIIEKLQAIGLKISPEDVFAYSKDGAPGRPHVARALLDKGYISNLKEAFIRYIGFKGPAYVSHYKLSPQEAIGLIKSVGGVSVCAHPGVYYNDDFIPMLVENGLGGIEVFYPSHKPEQIEKYKNLAYKYGLAITGGSDYHGLNSQKEVKLGDMAIPDGLVEKLKAKIV